MTCHEYALTESAFAGGTYLYVLTEPSLAEVYGNGKDMEMLADSGNVVAGDLLIYRGFAVPHATYVVSTRVSEGKRAPQEIKWKWLDSGVYSINQPRVDLYFATPMCNNDYPNDLTDGTKKKDLTWKFEYDGVADPEVYH
jgi:hypothetical protein